MTLADWIQDTKQRFRERDARTAAHLSASELAIGAGRRLGQYWNYGIPMWNRQWDVLIILDACRYDVFCEVAPEYDFLPEDPGWVYSPASQSREWMERHFREKFRHETEHAALMSVNVFTREDWVQADHFAHLDEIWKHSWDDELGTIPPGPITDAAVDFWRNNRRDAGADRMIAWYLQPHNPFVDAEWSDGWDRDIIGRADEHSKSVWLELRDGELDASEVWDAYRDNLRYVLDDVELLVDNLDASRVVITSDHGNGFGEFGIYGHPPYVPHPVLKRVPWVEVTARDTHSHTPNYEPASEDVTEGEVSDRLEALGYK